MKVKIIRPCSTLGIQWRPEQIIEVPPFMANALLENDFGVPYETAASKVETETRKITRKRKNK